MDERFSVKLVTVTPDAENIIAYCARVSNPSNQNNMATAPKLLSYCIKHGHWSVFEQASMTVEVVTSRAISSQILRHKSLNFQEWSQRYSKSQEFVIYPARRQDDKNRQNSLDNMSDEDKRWFEGAQKRINTLASELYEEALGRQIAKEQARFLLPLSTQTKMYITGNIRSWIHYLDVRCDVATQLEHREIANAIKAIFIKQFPVISEAKGYSL